MNKICVPEVVAIENMELEIFKYHLNETEMLKIADEIMAKKNYSNITAIKHLDKCLNCKVRVLELIYYYDYDILK